VEALVLLVIATLLTAGLYLTLDRTLLRVVVGLGLVSNGVNLLLLSTGGLQQGAAPIISAADQTVVDPLPQALILTAIVIAFGVTALLLTLSYRTYQSQRTDDLADLHGRLDDE